MLQLRRQHTHTSTHAHCLVGSSRALVVHSSTTRIPARSLRPLTEGVTLRAVTLGAVLSAAVVFLAVRSYIVVNRYSGFADHFNTVGAIFLLFLLALVCAGLRRLGVTWGLRSSEFAVVYAMMMVATAIPTMGWGGYLFPLITGVYYYATPENRWADTLLPHLRHWASPRDADAIRYIYEGLPKGASIPWGAWVEPLVWWSLFAVAFFVVSMALMSIMRKQWVENEKLVYPLSTVPLQMAEAVADSTGGLFRSPVMWAGFAFAFTLILYNFCIGKFPSLAGLPRPRLGSTVFIPRYGVGVMFNFDPLVVGLTSLVNMEVVFSVFFIHLLSLVELGFLNVVMGPSTGPPEPHANGGSAMANQQSGALFFLVLVSLWTARGHLRNLLRPQGEESEVLSHRRALALLVLGLGVMLWFQLKLGLPLPHAVAFLMLTLAMFFGTTRVLAQTGIGRLRAADSGVALITNILGTRTFGRKGMPALGMNFVWAADIQLFVMGTAAHGLKVVGEMGVRLRRIFFAMTLAFFVGLLVTYISYIVVGYRRAFIGGFGWYFVASPHYHWGWVADTVNNLHGPQWDRIGFLGLGAALAALLSAGFYRLTGWPLHPAGLAISLTNTVAIDWFSMFLVWAIKGVALRYGGLEFYRKMAPFFWGLILGSCVGTGLTALMDSFIL